jgi:hypothetical protein
MMSTKLGAFLFAWSVRAAFALLGALPIVNVGRAVIGEHPRSDAVLWDGGGAWLIELADEARGSVRAAMFETAGGALVGLVVWSLALGGMLAATRPGRTSEARECAVLALRQSSSLVLVGALEVFAKVALVVFSTAFVGFAWRLVQPMDASPRAFVLGASLGALTAWFVGVVVELARAHLVWTGCGTWRALIDGLAWLRARPFEVLRAASSRALLVVVGLGLVARVVVWALPAYPTVALVVVLLGMALPVLARMRFHAALAVRFELRSVRS